MTKLQEEIMKEVAGLEDLDDIISIVIDRTIELMEGKSDCWIWPGHITGKGYAQKKRNSKHFFVYRAIFEATMGEIPKGFVLDHLCRNRACVNPYHLEAVTHQVNILRGVGPTALNAKKTECLRGHPYTPENTQTDKKGRSCRACRINRAQLKQLESKATLSNIKALKV